MHTPKFTFRLGATTKASQPPEADEVEPNTKSRAVKTASNGAHNRIYYVHAILAARNRAT